ncbi:MAG TPA: LysR substrate-binding domain-containing protein [Candidatus Paceibacterota bacterium]|nr:LysR substrate-binding domain-containing protein [Verrucomicrobiota bacterium]HRY51504.1 LysR substrate-binding domain-containing protein [Candidatus Paceibacterota bacterium]
MELHQLRYLVAVAKTGNFSRAAELCHVSQPSLSQQIQKLEDELGERLFDRLSRQARLTPAGEDFLPRAKRVLAELETAQREVSERRGLLRGTITVGVLPTIAPYLLPGIIVAFGKAFPGIEVVVQEDTTSHLLVLGQAGDLDLMIVSSPVTDERFKKEPLFDEELLLALPADHPLARKSAITLADLDSERFILMREGHCLGDQVLNFCHRRDFRPQVSGRSTQISTILALVRAGAGISLVPQMVLASVQDATLVFRSLEKPQPRRRIVALWPHSHPLSRASVEFLKCLRTASLKPS